VRIRIAFINTWAEVAGRPLVAVFRKPAVPTKPNYPSQWWIGLLAGSTAEMLVVVFLLRPLKRREEPRC
jgi:hypothetical protein